MKRAPQEHTETAKKQKLTQHEVDSFVSLLPKDVLLDCITPLLRFRDVISMERITKSDREFFCSHRVWNVFYKRDRPFSTEEDDDIFPVWEEGTDANEYSDDLVPYGDPLRPGTMHLQCKMLDGQPGLMGASFEDWIIHRRYNDSTSGEYTKYSWMDEKRAYKMFKQQQQMESETSSPSLQVEHSAISAKELYKKNYIHRVKRKYYWQLVGCNNTDIIYEEVTQHESDFPPLKECHCKDSQYLEMFQYAPKWILIPFYMMLCAEMDGHGLLSQYFGNIKSAEEDLECQLCTRHEINEEEKEDASEQENEEETETMLICDGCEKGFHLNCLKLNSVPQEDTWHCPVCDKMEEKKNPPKMCHHEQIKKGLDEAVDSWCDEEYSQAVGWMGYPLHFTPAAELRNIKEVLEANFGYLVHYMIDDMEEFIPEEINADLWPYHSSVQEIEKGLTDEQSILNTVHKIMRKSGLKKCDPYVAHSSIHGMKQLLRTIIETADLIKNEQPQNDANEEITEVHIKQAIEELDMDFFCRNRRVEAGKDVQPETVDEEEQESKAKDEIQLEQKLFTLAEEIYKRHNMELPSRKEGEDFWACFESVLTNYVPREEEDENSDSEESEENQNDNNFFASEESESEEEEDYNAEVEEQVIKRMMKEDVKEYGVWDYFEDSDDDTSEVTQMHKLRYELREAVEKLLNEHFGIDMEE